MSSQPHPASIKIEEVRENPLLNRKEVLFTLLHEGGATPDRWTVRQTLSQLLKAPLDCVIVKRLSTRAGSCRTSGHAHVYETKEEAAMVEPRHIYVRNLPPEERAKVAKVAKEAKKEAEGRRGVKGGKKGGKGG
ncbi:MAG: hypothetical protein QXT74_00735 [Candidatus Nezhaarchaeales archaeon]